MHLKSQDSCFGKHDGVKFTLFKLSKSGLNVSPDRHHVQVWAAIPQLCGSSLAAGTDTCVGRQFIQFNTGLGDEAVQNRFACGDSSQRQARVLFGRQVFKGMNGNIRFIVQQRQLDSLCEKPNLPRAINRSHVGVAAADQRYQDGGYSGLSEAFCNVFSLPKSEGAFAGRDPEGCHKAGSNFRDSGYAAVGRFVSDVRTDRKLPIPSLVALILAFLVVALLAGLIRCTHEGHTRPKGATGT